MASIKISGFNKLARQLIRLGKDADRELAKALYQEAEEIMADAKENYVPVDWGALRGSGFVEQPKGSVVILGFGGPAAPYAVYVHENMQAHHNVGSAKYLEIPLNKAKNGLAGRIIMRLKGKL